VSGLLVGALVGLTGVGGGSLLTPLLILVLGSIPGVWLGSHASARMPVGALRAVLATVLVASGVALSAKAGWAPSLLSFAVCALPGVALATVLTRRQSRSSATTVRKPVSEQA